MKKLKYTFRDSPFFRLRTKLKLATLLYVSQNKLQNIANAEERYFEFQKPKKSGEMRDISAPIQPLKIVQARVADLLKRIVVPDYLFAPVEGKSYADNAAYHIGSKALHLLDIDDFFPSCTINKAIWFFHTKMECSKDVSAILARIVTYNNCLPQGSPCSPILAYLCYSDMWDEIACQCNQFGCKLSVYADDLTISGDRVSGDLVWRIKETLFRHGHRFAANKEKRAFNRPAEITGVILRPTGVFAPNRQHKKIIETKESLKQSKDAISKTSLEYQLHGRLAQLKQIKDAGKKHEQR